MSKNFKDINWKDVDFSDYKEDIKEINKYMDELLKRPSIKKALLKFKINDLQKKAELGEHYKHLYSEVKKQKDDVVSEIKRVLDIWENKPNEIATLDLEEILRMLGEIDE